MFKTKMSALVSIAIVALSCSKKTTAPSAESSVAVAKIELPAEIAAGKTLYENSCARCHKLFPVTKHNKNGWSGTLDRMAPKAKITEEQKTLVYNYLTYGM